MKIFLIIILTSLVVVILMFLLNAASFDGVGKNKLPQKNALKNAIDRQKNQK